MSDAEFYFREKFNLNFNNQHEYFDYFKENNYDILYIREYSKFNFFAFYKILEDKLLICIFNDSSLYINNLFINIEEIDTIKIYSDSFYLKYINKSHVNLEEFQSPINLEKLGKANIIIQKAINNYYKNLKYKKQIIL
jgi:hypothetical protein